VPGVDVLVVAHDGDGGALRGMAPGNCALIPQCNADFGTRLTSAVDAPFAHGAGRVVIVGSDCPTLPEALLMRAFQGLTDHAATLIPARDGGWIALGVRAPLGEALRGVRWSADTTQADTVAALKRDGRLPLILPPWYDVDEPADLARLAEELKSPAASERAPHTAASMHLWQQFAAP